MEVSNRTSLLIRLGMWLFISAAIVAAVLWGRK